MAKRLGAKIMQVSPGYLSTVQAVQVGRTLSADEVANATIHICPQQFGREAKSKPPFPSDPHQDAKAWDFCAARKGSGPVAFWNAAGPAQSWVMSAVPQ